jgi:hypothetical protein
MSEILTEIIRKQTHILFDNIKETLDSYNTDLIQEQNNLWPIWKQFYHMLHSLDEWFINPLDFREPAIHKPYFRTSDPGPDKLIKE